MTSDQFRSQIYDVALDPERWPDALRILTEAMGFVGASCRLVNHRTGQNDWIGAHGPTSRGKADYLAHYYSHDRLVPAVQGATPGQIVQMRKALTPDELRQIRGITSTYGSSASTTGCRSRCSARLGTPPC